MADMIEVSLWRGKDDGRYQTFQVPQRENQTVLDIVTWVQRHADPTLSYRFACRVGMCGSCAMTVNGRPRWTCRTHIVQGGGGRQAGDRPARQSAGDQGSRLPTWPASSRSGSGAKGVFAPSKTRADPIEKILPTSAQRVAADAAIECINCAVCFAACDTVRWNEDYLGPAALNRAWTLVNDVQRRRQHASGWRRSRRTGGCHACHSHQSCQEHCPNKLNPTASIAGLKRRTMQAYIKGEL